MDPLIDRYIGIPYRFGGETMEGADCWGLVRLISREVYGHELPSVERPSSDNYEIAAVAVSCAVTFPLERVEIPIAGDLVLLTIYGVPCHIGIVVGDGYMVHTLFKHDSALARLDDRTWSRRTEGIYRVKSQADSPSPSVCPV